MSSVGGNYARKRGEKSRHNNDRASEDYYTSPRSPPERAGPYRSEYSSRRQIPERRERRPPYHDESSRPRGRGPRIYSPAASRQERERQDEPSSSKDLDYADNDDDPRARRRKLIEKLRDSDDVEAARLTALAAASALPRLPQVTEEKEKASDEEEVNDEEKMSISSEDGGGESSSEDAETKMMREMMGISSFDTTKNRAHTDEDISGVRRRTKRKYRQYMNRKGGFNRPLSPVH